MKMDSEPTACMGCDHPIHKDGSGQWFRPGVEDPYRCDKIPGLGHHPLEPVEGIDPCRICGMDLGANDPHGADCPVGQLADLQAEYDDLVERARYLGDNWEHGDLAGAVQGLLAALPEQEDDQPEGYRGEANALASMPTRDSTTFRFGPAEEGGAK